MHVKPDNHVGLVALLHVPTYVLMHGGQGSRAAASAPISSLGPEVPQSQGWHQAERKARERRGVSASPQPVRQYAHVMLR